MYQVLFVYYWTSGYISINPLHSRVFGVYLNFVEKSHEIQKINQLEKLIPLVKSTKVTLELRDY